MGGAKEQSRKKKKEEKNLLFSVPLYGVHRGVLPKIKLAASW
jgi:hypothetical protein